MAELSKIVIPVAGLGTRVLPASKVLPKEMLTVVDKPVIQYVIEEAVDAGFSDIILVSSPGKQMIETHFKPQPTLEAMLQAKGKNDLLDAVRNTVPTGVTISTVFQDQPRGLGHAIACAAELVGNKAFAVSLPDVLIHHPDGDHARDLKHIANAYHQTHAAQILVEPVPYDEVNKYGIVDCGDTTFTPGESHPVMTMVEKPDIGTAPSNQSIIGRYILPARIMEILRSTPPGAGQEIQLTDAINALISEVPVNAVSMHGKTYDCGSILGYMVANARFAMSHPEIGTDFCKWLDKQDWPS